MDVFTIEKLAFLKEKLAFLKFLLVPCYVRLGGGPPDILSNQKSHVGINAKLRGWVPLFENYDFQVGIDTNFGVVVLS